MASGSEEANALVRVGKGAYAEPNLRATQVEIYEGLYAESQNRFPNLKVDIGAVNSLLPFSQPAFYYKTFMWPASLWMSYEHVIRHAAGLGKVADDPQDPDRYDHMHAHCEVLVAGGGATGLMAALQAAAQSGARVILADEQNELGGWLLGESDVTIGDKSDSWIADMVATLSKMENVTLLPRTTIFGYMDHNFVTMCERVTDHLETRPCSYAASTHLENPEQ